MFKILLIIMIPSAIAWFAQKDERIMLPKDITGETMSTGHKYVSKR